MGLENNMELSEEFYNHADFVKALSSNTAFFNQSILSDMFSIPMPDMHREIYRALDDNSIRIIVVLMPRGFAKTTILQGYLTRVVVNQQHETIAYVADTQPQAERHTETVREELDYNDKITTIYGKLSGRKWGSTHWRTKHGISVMPFGANQSMRGLKVGKSRPSLLILDDLENDENAATLEQRDKLWRNIFAVMKPMLTNTGKDVKLVYLGTAVHEDCVLLRLIDLLKSEQCKNDPSIKVIEFAARDEANTANYPKGEPMWEELWDNERLIEEEKFYAEAGLIDIYYQEYMCQTVSTKDSEFPKEAVKYYHVDELPSDLRVYGSVDVKWSKNRKSDYNSVVIFGTSMSAKSVFILEAIRKRCSAKEFLNLLEHLNNSYRPSRVFLQNVVLDEFFAFYAHERGTRLPFQKVSISRQKNAKIRRISSLEPLYITERLMFKKQHSDILAELWKHPRPKHDDLSDALATGINNVSIPWFHTKESIRKPDYDSFEFVQAWLKNKRHTPTYGLSFLPGNFKSH